jgi:hypothetical protein
VNSKAETYEMFSLNNTVLRSTLRLAFQSPVFVKICKI